MISRETFEAEIAELTVEINRRLSAARSMFAEIGELRAEIDLLNKILDVRDRSNVPASSVTIILLGFVLRENDDPRPFCAVTWSGAKEQPSEVEILLKTGWRSLIPDWSLDYFIDVSEDWRQSIQTRPATILSQISELSVGPLRTMQEAKLSREMVKKLIAETLGETEHLPGISIVD